MCSFLHKRQELLVTITKIPLKRHIRFAEPQINHSMHNNYDNNLLLFQVCLPGSNVGSTINTSTMLSNNIIRHTSEPSTFQLLGTVQYVSLQCFLVEQVLARSGCAWPYSCIGRCRCSSAGSVVTGPTIHTTHTISYIITTTFNQIQQCYRCTLLNNTNTSSTFTYIAHTPYLPVRIARIY